MPTYIRRFKMQLPSPLFSLISAREPATSSIRCSCSRWCSSRTAMKGVYPLQQGRPLTSIRTSLNTKRRDYHGVTMSKEWVIKTSVCGVKEPTSKSMSLNDWIYQDEMSCVPRQWSHQRALFHQPKTSDTAHSRKHTMASAEPPTDPSPLTFSLCTAAMEKIVVSTPLDGIQAGECGQTGRLTWFTGFTSISGTKMVWRGFQMDMIGSHIEAPSLSTSQPS